MDWTNFLSSELLKTVKSVNKNPLTPYAAFALARDYGQAALANIPVLEHELMDANKVSLAMLHMQSLSFECVDGCAELARRWQDWNIKEQENLEVLTMESESLMQTIHDLNCAWWSIEEIGSNPKWQQQNGIKLKHLSILFDLVKIRFEQPDARPILASSWEFLEKYRERFPKKSEVHAWWHLSASGAAARAFAGLKTTAAEAGKAIRDSMLGQERVGQTLLSPPPPRESLYSSTFKQAAYGNAPH